MSNHDPACDLEVLLSALFEGRLSAADGQRLDEWLARDEQARQLYLDFVEVHTFLRKQLAVADAAVLRNVDRVEPMHRARSRFVMRPQTFSITVAAAVVGVLLSVMYFMVPPVYRAMTRSEPLLSYEVVARLTGDYEAIWVEGQIGSHPGDFLVAGRRMDLIVGLAEVTFASGAKVVIEGPAQIRVDGRNHCTLEAGKLVGQVPRSARGFVVSTPRCEVVDLGTEFGVEVQGNDATQVHVYQGRVQFKNLEQKKMHELTAGQTVRATADGKITIDRTSPQQQFARQLPTYDSQANGETVAYVVLPGARGSQDFGEALGFDFVVVRAIDVTRLGVYDNGADGLQRTITAELWRRDDGGTPEGLGDDRGIEIVATQRFTPEEPGQLEGSSRFQAFAEPLVLAPGAYSIVAHGYGPGELLSNDGSNPDARHFKTRSSGRGAIDFGRGSRFGIAGEFPATIDSPGNPQQYAAGTFAFRERRGATGALTHSATEHEE